MKNNRLLIIAVSLILIGGAGVFGARMQKWAAFRGGSMAGMMSGGGMMGNMTLMTNWMNGETLPVDLDTPKPAKNEGSIKEGGIIFKDRCAVCHGLKGDGNGERAKDLMIKPRDFTYAIFKFRSTPSGSLPTEEDIFKTVSRGLHGTSMLPWVGVTTQDKWKVVYYVESLSEFFAEGEKPVAVTIPAIIKSRQEYVEQGKGVYKKAKCWECHGHEGYGDGENMDKLKDDWLRPIKPTNFRRQILKRGLNVGDIYLTIKTGLTGSPMPSYSSSLTEDEILALAHYIRSLTPEPSGGGMMMGMMKMSADERIGMMTDMPGMPMGRGMMMQTRSNEK